MTQAYVYIRFSDPKQEKGDSYERQKRDCLAYCERKGWEVAEIVQDLGKSAWKGHHLSEGNLGKFAVRVQTGQIPSGSVLVVEQLDRLSRLEWREARDWLERICRNGMKVAVVNGDSVYDDHALRTNPMTAIEILMKGQLAHAESQQKSERVSNAKRTAHANAMADVAAGLPPRIMTRKCPSWLTPNPDGRGFKENEKAELVREIYRLSAAGRGTVWISSHFNSRKIPSWGYVAGTWDVSTINNILRAPSVEGDYVPGFSNTKSLSRTKLAGRIVGYYPRVVDAKLVSEARAAMASRKGAGGRHRNNVANLFAGLIRCAECGSPMAMKMNGDKNPQRHLVCNSALRNRGCINKASFRYFDFEKAALDTILHLALDNSYFAEGDKTVEIALKLAETQKAIEVAENQRKILVKMALAHGADAVAAELAETMAALKALSTQQGELEQGLTVARGQVGDLEHAQRVLDVRYALYADNEETRQEARLKVQSALRAIISSVECDGADTYRDASGEKTLTMILQAGVVAVKFDNRGNVIKGVDGHLPTAIEEGLSADLIRRINAV